MLTYGLGLLASFAVIVTSGCDEPNQADRPVTIADIAGSYYFGDGKSTNCRLQISAEGTFRFSWQGCLGEYGRNHGAAKVEAGHLVLGPEQPNKDGIGGTPTDFVMVQWGPRLYLVPVNQGKRFCNRVNLGMEPRSRIYGGFYIRDGDVDKKTEGLPNVPIEWRPWLRTTPLQGTIIEGRLALLTSLALLKTSGRDEPTAPNPPTSIADVAGYYYFGDGTGMNCHLHIDVMGTFDFSWRGCGGEYGRNHGPVSVRNERLTLTPELPNRFAGTATEFFIVEWGPRMYLVPVGEGKSFCNDVNSGDEPRTEAQGSYYVRRGNNDWNWKVEGLPKVPAAWRPWLLAKPLTGTITEVRNDGSATVDIGARSGAWVGLMLRSYEILGALEVISVDEESCTVRACEFLDAKEFAQEFMPKKGQKVASNLDSLHME